MDVTHLGGERRRPGGVGRIVGEQAAIALHRRSAAGGIDDDGVEGVIAECVDETTGRLPGVLSPAGVQHEGAAAALGAGRDDVAALGRQHSRRRLVHRSKQHPLHAPGEHSDPQPCHPFGLEAPIWRQPDAAAAPESDGKGEPPQLSQGGISGSNSTSAATNGKRFERPLTAKQAGKTEAPRRQGDGGGQAEAPWVGEEREDGEPEHPLCERALVERLELLSRSPRSPRRMPPLTGRRRGMRGSRDRRRDAGRRQPARLLLGREEAHQLDPAAGRVCLLTPER